MEEGKRHLASSHQYGNALLGIRHQEEEVYSCTMTICNSAEMVAVEKKHNSN